MQAMTIGNNMLPNKKRRTIQGRGGCRSRTKFVLRTDAGQSRGAQAEASKRGAEVAQENDADVVVVYNTGMTVQKNVGYL